MADINVKAINPNISKELLNKIKQFLTKNLDIVIDKIAEMYAMRILKDEYRTIISPTRIVATLVTGIPLDICNFSSNFAPGFEQTDYNPVYVFVDEDYIIIPLRNKIGHAVHVCGYLFASQLSEVSKDKAEDFLTIYAMLSERITSILENEEK